MAISKLGFSFSTKSQAAFSANVFWSHECSQPIYRLSLRVKIGAHLACPIGVSRVHGLLPGDRVPFFLAINLGVLLSVHNRSEGRGDDYPLDLWRVRFDSFQNARGSLDGRVQEIFHRIQDIKMEWRCGVQDIVEGGI